MPQTERLDKKRFEACMYVCMYVFDVCNVCHVCDVCDERNVCSVSNVCM